MTKLKVTKKMVKMWDYLKLKINGFPQEHSYDDIKSVLGWNLWWNNPSEVLWLWTTDNAEDYEGQQTQFGIKQDGTIVWAYYSHCSCNSYSEYGGEFQPFKDEDFKSYELNDVPEDIMDALKKRLMEVKLWMREELK